MASTKCEQSESGRRSMRGGVHCPGCKPQANAAQKGTDAAKGAEASDASKQGMPKGSRPWFPR
eukprot:6178627-Pleurochrysis_carterae.AAC.2